MCSQRQQQLQHVTITLTLNNNKISEMKNGSLSGLSLLKRLLWSVLPPEAMLMPMTGAAKGDHADFGLPPETMWEPMLSLAAVGKEAFFADCRLITENEGHRRLL